VLPGHPEPAVSWHSGFREGAHARPKTTPVHHAAKWGGSGVAAPGAMMPVIGFCAEMAEKLRSGKTLGDGVR